jgi:hypothetical protein
LRIDPIFTKRKFTAESDLLFVLMPFTEELEVIYADHIKKVAQKLNLRCRRADDIFSNSVIIEDIWDFINRARLIIADLTNKNPNVFYEVGLAHVVGKPVVLITQSIDDIPFDLRHLRHIVYEYTPRGMQKFEETLQNTVEFILKQPQTSVEQFKQDLVADDFPNSAALSDYANQFVIKFAMDRVNEVFLREKAIELCFKRGIIEQADLDALHREKNETLRKSIAKLIEKYVYSVSKNLIVALLEDERSVALAAIGAAYSLAKNGQYSSDIFRYVNAHSSWEVHRRAVERIIELDDQDSLPTLLGFQKLDYHLTVDNIRRYVEQLKSEGRLNDTDRPMVIAFLNRYLKEDRFSDITKANLTKTLTGLDDH